MEKQGGQRIKFPLKFRTVIDYKLYSGKAEPETANTAPVLATVPEGYKDKLPFAFQKGDTVALGNGLADRMQHDAWTETLLQSALKGQNFLSAICHFPGTDPINIQEVRDHHWIYKHIKADVIFAMFGFNESFDGPNNANNHKNLLVDFVGKLRSYQPNGKSFPRIVLFSPIAFQNLIVTFPMEEPIIAIWQHTQKQLKMRERVCNLLIFSTQRSNYSSRVKNHLPSMVHI